jgi:hypothetical protein
MNYDSLTYTILDDFKAEVALINNPEIDPETRRYNLEIVLREIGTEVYNVVYDMNAFDMGIDYTNGKTINDAYYGLAKNISDSISTGGKSNIQAQLEEWLSNQVLKAQYDAFWNAKEFGQFPTVERSASPSCCDWCAAVVGTFVDPSGDVFRRHDRCRCIIKTSGYKTRNGIYTGDRKAWRYQG